MTALEIWTVIAGGTIVTYLTRLSFLVLMPADRMPSFAQRALTYAPPSVLAAIILPEVLLEAGRLALSPNNPRLLAATAAAIVAWRTKNTWLTMLLGMLALWTATTLFGAP